ncbi:MAG: RNA polymerase sigma-70 factor [Bacteroidota bacterium]
MNEKLNQEKIIKALTNGSEPAFEKLFRKYYPRLSNYAKTFLSNSSEAEDLVQDVFIQIWNNRETLDTEKHFSSFIFTLVRNRCLNNLKKKVVEDKFVATQALKATEELYHISFKVEEEFISMEEKLKTELEKIMEEMPNRCQVAFKLKWIEGKKNREIAETMKISTTMVDKHLAKGLEIARNKLTPEMFLFFYIIKD